jgi:tetratricopeptide (TPR) repeat protein
MSEDLELLFNEAEQHRFNGEYEEAVAKYKRVLEEDPEHARAHLGLGLVYSFTGEFDEAIAEMEKAVALAPDDVECHLKLGLTYTMLGMYEEGKREFLHVLRLDPGNAEALKQLSYFPDVDVDQITAGEIPEE